MEKKDYLNMLTAEIVKELDNKYKFKKYWKILINNLLTRHTIKDSDMLAMLKVGSLDELQKFINILYVMEENIVDLDQNGNFFLTFKLSPTIEEELALCHYPMPEITQPKPLTTPFYDNGEHVITGGNPNELDYRLGYLNKINSIKLSVVEVNEKLQLPPYNSSMSHEQWRKELLNRRKNFNVTQKIKQKLPDQFYLTNQLDKRGRTYCKGFHVNPMGDDCHKASVSFAKKEVIKSDYWVKIEIANRYGLDKWTFDDRVEWVDSQKDLDTLVETAEEPYQFRRAVEALKEFRMKTPTNATITLDSTCSAIQITSALVADYNGMRMTNLIPNGERNDAYSIIHKKTGLPNILRKDCKEAVMTAVYGSKSVPNRVYGNNVHIFWQAMEDSMPDVMTYLVITQNAWNPKATAHSWAMPDGFDVHIPVLVKQNGTIQLGDRLVPLEWEEIGCSQHQKSLSANILHSVDGLVVREMHERCNYDPAEVERVYKLLDSSNNKQMVISSEVKRLHRLYEESKFLSMRIIPMLTENNINLFPKDEVRNLLDSLPDDPFEILTIHDAFRCLVNNVDSMRAQYVNVIKDIHKGSVLQSILRQVCNDPKLTLKIDNYVDKIQLGYAIC